MTRTVYRCSDIAGELTLYGDPYSADNQRILHNWLEGWDKPMSTETDGNPRALQVGDTVILKPQVVTRTGTTDFSCRDKDGYSNAIHCLDYSQIEKITPKPHEWRVGDIAKCQPVFGSDEIEILGTTPELLWVRRCKDGACVSRVLTRCDSIVFVRRP